MAMVMTYDSGTGQYEPRSGDGSIAAEDDALLRQPADDPIDDPDLETGEDDAVTGDDPVDAANEADHD